MKYLLFTIPLLFLTSCNKSSETSSITKEGVAEFIYFSTGPTTSTLLTDQTYKGTLGKKATYTYRYRNPTIKLDDAYIEISYPGTDSPVQVITRESLLALQWKVDQSSETPAN